MTAARYNLKIDQGSTFLFTVALRNKIVLSSAATLGATELAVSPLAHGLTNGDVLTFGTIPVTLTASASAGARTIAVSAISAAIAKGTTAKGDPVDLTGKSARAAIRAQYSDTAPLASFTCTVSNTPTTGEITISLPSTTSATLPANISPDRADDIADLQAVTFPSVTEAKLFLAGKAPYYFDLEVFDTASPPIVTRYVFGRVLVLAEATKP
jgi:hypothetical protein